MSFVSEKKTNAPLISVIMTNYNGEMFVAKSIESVLSQTYVDFELIIIDDCSSDDSVNIIRQYSEKDGRIRIVLKEKNEGVALARNSGIEYARGKYIAFIDNDDIWEKDKLQRQLEIAENSADIVYCSYDFIDEDGKKIKKPYTVPETTCFDSMLVANVIGLSAAMVKTELLKDHPFRTDYYHEDYLLWMELLKIPVCAKGDVRVLMHYRKRSGSRSDKKANAAKERWKIYRKALGLSFFKSSVSFVRYSVNGALKHFL